MRQIHPVEYNQELYQEAENSSRKRWSEDEVYELASAEARYRGPQTELLDYLACKFGRSREAIKKRRQTVQFRTALEQQGTGRATGQRAKPGRCRSSRAVGGASDSSESEDGGDGGRATRQGAKPGCSRSSYAVGETSDSSDSEDAHDGENLAVLVEESFLSAELLSQLQEEAGERVHSDTEAEPIVGDPIADFLRAALELGDLEECDARLVAEGVKSQFDTTILDDWVNALITKYRSKKRDQNRTPRPVAPQIQATGRRKRRQQEYKQVQSLFDKNPALLAKRIINNEALFNDSGVTPEPAELVREYDTIFGNDSPQDHAVYPDLSPCRDHLYVPITEDEIRLALKSTRTNTPGPDGVTLADAKKIPCRKLCFLYNLMHMHAYTPVAFREGYTTLIPKPGGDLASVKSWRPITITSILLRVCSKIIASRLSKNVELNSKQRGFAPVDGCYANNLTLATVIRAKRDRAQPYSIIALDLQKAFDTVSVNSIGRALRGRAVDEGTVQFILSTYQGFSTTLNVNNSRIGSVAVKRGVRQGDPLSPILFNIILDELVSHLDSLKGLQVDNVNISCLAYADDLILLADNKHQANRLLREAIRFFDSRGLRLNVAKCASVSTGVVPAKKKIFVNHTSVFYAYGQPLPALGPKDLFKYLGAKYSPVGLSKVELGELSGQLSRIVKAPLKPGQKLQLLKGYLIPRYVHLTQHLGIRAFQLREVDRKVRGAVKKILRLPIHITNSALHAPLRHGGLGIFPFRSRIPVVMVRRWTRLQGIDTALDGILALSGGLIDRIKRQIRDDLSSKQLVDSALKEELERSWWGHGLNQVGNNRASSAFIDAPPRYWPGKDYVAAVKLRLNTLPTRAIPSNPPEMRLCRAGCRRQETLSHVLQRCPVTHWPRIKRHDEIVRKVASWSRQGGFSVIMEPHVRSADGVLFKPDLAFIKDGQVIISDVAVSWESPAPLTAAYVHKRATYSRPEFLDACRRLWNTNNITVCPFIVGARGCLAIENRELVEALNLTSRQLQEVVTMALKGGVITHKHFMRVVWRGGAPAGGGPRRP